MMLAAILLTVYRMIVLPVQFQDRPLSQTRQEIRATVEQAEAYFNRQYGGQTTFRFELAPVTTLSREAAWYGTDQGGKKDIHLHEAVREAIDKQQGFLNLSLYDNDSDGYVDNICLLTAGPGEQESGKEDDIRPQATRLSDNGGTLRAGEKTIDLFTACPEGRLGLFCHEFGHVLGLKDLYDTDGEFSEGTSPGLYGLSLMDEGCLKDTPPDFTAAEFELLGLGRCDTLAVKHYDLPSLLEGRTYLKALTPQKDEFFLFGNDNGRLLVHHIDRSDNPAGYSTRLNTELTAQERWEANAVNDNPEHPCAVLIPADPDAPVPDRFAFPRPGVSHFGSDSPVPFRSWRGSTSALALTDIRVQADKSISFDVIEPVLLTDLTVFQDAAILCWQVSDKLQGIQGIEVSWTDGEEEFHMTLSPQTAGYTLENLKPKTEYSVTVRVHTGDRASFSVSVPLLTKIYREGIFPYIYLNNITRNLDGSFPAGTRIPLRVFNATDVQDVRWTMDGAAINPGPDGRYTLNASGTLKATILHTDGTSEILLKEIIVQ